MYLRTPKTNSKLTEQYDYSFPSDDEIRFIGRAQEECYYYQKGLDICKGKVEDRFKNSNQQADQIDASKCKDVLDAYYNCTTYDYYGRSVEDIEEEAKPFMKNYANCLFRDFELTGNCRKYFDDVLRYYFRKEDSPLHKI